MPSTATSCLGIDVGGTRIKWCLLDSDSVLERGEVPTSKKGGESLVDQIVELVDSVGGAADSVGLAVPGPVDTVKRETLVIPNIPGEWDGYPIARHVEDRSGKPLRLLNDARAFGYAEFHLGAGRDFTDALFLTVGTGIGGAIAQGGQLVIGDLDSVPEMGHIAVEVGGERCGCGATGCLETVASASAVVANSMRAVITGQSPILIELCDGRVENLSAEAVAKAADAGDPWATAAFNRAGTFIGMAAASYCVTLHTQAVVLGGGLAGAFRHLAPAIDRVIAERISLTGPVKVVNAALGSYAGAIGAALYAQHWTHPHTEPATLSATQAKTDEGRS